MIMELIRLPVELDFVRNQILSGATIPDYESVSEQLLRLGTPYTFGLISTSSPNESYALASHYHGRSGGNKERGGQRRGIRCNYCNRYGHIEVDCSTKTTEPQ